MLLNKIFVLVSIFVGLANAYNCPADQCKPPACMCPSQQPPGGLSPRNIPQFITLTWDDAVTSINQPVMLNIMGNNNNYKNPNGCPLAATFFISTQYNEFSLAQRLYNQGNEIGVHTMNHLSDPSPQEIVGAYRALNAWSGVPKKDILGFRTPFLNYTTDTWKRVRGTGKFLYDSSMTMNPSQSYWPYTMDYGPVNECQTGTCDPNFGIPGLWQIPMYNMLNTDGSINTSMDPNAIPGSNITDLRNPTAEQLQAMWRYNFNRNYNGDRKPFGVYLHAYWVGNNREERIKALQDFITWTRQYNDVYWVTNQQLLGWMLNPTNIQDSLNNPALGCMTAPIGSNVCDGISKLGEDCLWTDANVYQGYYRFGSCFSCPTRPPNVTDLGPVPPQKNNKICFIPDDGCEYPQIWDPDGCKCTNTNRLAGGPAPRRSFKLGDPIREWIGEDGYRNITGKTGDPDPRTNNQASGLLSMNQALFVSLFGMLSVFAL